MGKLPKKKKADKPSVEQIKAATTVPVPKSPNEGDGGVNPLTNPSLATAEAPAQFNVMLRTTKGDVLLESFIVIGHPMAWIVSTISLRLATLKM